jgi:hypothetical protein
LKYSFFPKINKPYHRSHSIRGEHAIALVSRRIIGRGLKEMQLVGFSSFLFEKKLVGKLTKKFQEWILGFIIGQLQDIKIKG